MASEPIQRADDDVPEIDDQPFIDATSKAKAKYGRFNLAIIGGTGVGKSSLVNAVFGRDLAKTGKGLPVTEGAKYYYDNSSLGIWDIEGFEVGKQSPAEAFRVHLQAIAARPREEQVSVVWYCVNASSDKLTLADIALIRELDSTGLPVILVLTKVAWEKNPVTGKFKAPKDVEEFRKWLEHPVDNEGDFFDLPVQRVILTAAQGKGAGQGLGELVTETLALSPDDEKDAFRIAQKLNLPWKRDMVRRVIAGATTAAATAAAIPIPIAAATVLAPIQLTMMGSIAAIYELELKSMLSPAGLAQLAVQVSGRALASGLLTLIPGAGAVLNATVAGALTAAAGEGWLRLCEQVHLGKVDLSKLGNGWQEYVPGLLDVTKKMLGQWTKKA